MSVKNVTLSSGVEGLFIENQRFNTTLISFNFYMPLEKKKVAANALLPFILTSCSKAYPDFSRLNYKLNKLYGDHGNCFFKHLVWKILGNTG